MHSAARRLGPALALVLGSAAGTDLRITDVQGTEVLVRGASVDYGKWYSVDRIADGIRLMQGAGVVTLRWAAVDTLTLVRVDSARPPGIAMDVVLRNHSRVRATLYQDGNMKLLGRSELGEYEIDLEKVRMIVPAR